MRQPSAWLPALLCAGTLLAFQSCASAPAGPPTASPGDRGARLDVNRLNPIRQLVADAIAARQIPGAVVVVGSRDRVVFREAFGHRALVPEPEPMTADTIFDMASLTKVMATTPAIMLLVEQGRLGLDDSVARHLPELDRYGKGRISVRHLLTHTSGLRAGLDLSLPFAGRDGALQLAADEVLEDTPGSRFIYSDINFVLLGEIVARASGESLDRFAAARLFEPLAMRHTLFLPPAEMHDRIAPTERCDPLAAACPGDSRSILRGVVHDPTARRMGGVAGSAGLFSTADDAARFCRMILNGGVLDGTRVLGTLSVRLMTHPALPDTMPNVRGLGWDVDSVFASVRGDLLPVGSFGHTGWTGTSLWIDPATATFVVLLSNRGHPDGSGDVRELRERIANVVGAAVVAPSLPPSVRQVATVYGPRPMPSIRTAAEQNPVLPGIDVLALDGFAALHGRRVGLLTNHTGRNRAGASTIDVLRTADGMTLVALFSPEHGIRGIADERVGSGRDERAGLPIHSLYGESRRPDDAMLDGIDTIVIDLQDAGSRFYTYMTTMAYVLEEAAKRRIRVVVLDRPNPINGYQIEGPVQDEGARGFTGYFPMPVRHGLTMGELARLFNAEGGIGADLEVVPMRHWSRRLWYDETGLMWIDPSPNMRNLHEAILYPGLGSLEWSNISVGRGTHSPFEQVGAPWIDGTDLAAALNARRLPGIRFYPVRFTPNSSVYAGEPCGGVFMVVTDREALRPVRVGAELAAALSRLYGPRYETRETWKLFGSREQLEALGAGADPASISEKWRADEARWRRLRAKYLLY
jgi:uncharacterized protein YbbC (DUF1343 family)/CubicO group peptidase (beta-lactamase class C family)